jgi:type IV pilus assembly protein PilB
MKDEELKNLLLDAGLLTHEEIQKAVNETNSLKQPLEKVIVDMQILSAQSLYELIAKHIKFEYISLSNVARNEEVISIVPEGLAKQTQSVPIMVENGVLHIAMQDPTNIYLVDQLQVHTGYPLQIYISSIQEIEDAFKRVYSGSANITPDLMQGLSKKPPETKEAFVMEGASVIKIVDLIISQAVRDRASDIHIEPEQDLMRIRFRIDGILHEIPAPPKEWEPAIISRLKVLSGMDIAESRVPQDGHFQAKIENRVVDFRISTVPTIYGENLVMRLLDTASVMVGLENLGFSTAEELKRYEKLITKPYGIILSTGPTGSGKTTTLYSALMKINSVSRNIITIEDPVEYRLGLIRQIQVNAKVGITFANGLRAILRQDPDVIMVGEIRDLETGAIAIQAALTGHLVFSSLHTNDAPSAIMRLINMGIEPFLISASLIGVVAQRLIRLICPDCKEQYSPTEAVLKKWGLEGKKNVSFWHGRGCDKCKGTGYRGRSGIFELMSVDDEIREMIISNVSVVALRKKLQEKGMRLLREDGVEKVLKGLTTIDEIARVTEEYVEIKSEVSEPENLVEPLVEPHPDGQVKEIAPKDVQVKAEKVEEYQKRISTWLGRKK